MVTNILDSLKTKTVLKKNVKKGSTKKKINRKSNIPKPRGRSDIRVTKLYCHDCGNNFAASFDFSINGNHVVKCPHCEHEHCRVIVDGVVAGDRWDTRNGDTLSYVGYSLSNRLSSYNDYKTNDYHSRNYNLQKIISMESWTQNYLDIHSKY